MKKIEIAINGILLVVNGFLLALIICLFLFRPGERADVEVTIDRFQDNSRQYYEEDEAYRQVNDNIDTYKASGRPDQ